MLVMSCAVGGKLILNDTTRIAFRAGYGHSIAVSIYTPAETAVTHQGELQSPLTLLSGNCSYQFHLQDAIDISIDSAEIRVATCLEASNRIEQTDRLVHIGISAVGPIRVSFIEDGDTTTPCVRWHPIPYTTTTH